MNITFSYADEFDALIKRLKEKYGNSLFDIEGIGQQLDLDWYNKQFFKSQYISDATIDSNANVRAKHMGIYFAEAFKPFTKLNSLYVIWKELRDAFGLERANEFFEEQLKGGIYVHDSASTAYLNYCFAFTLRKIVEEGLVFIDTIKSEPAQHADTFIQHVIQFVMFSSNQMSGAVGLPDFFIWLWYFVKKDYPAFMNMVGAQKKIHQLFQIFTYSINQPIRGSQQSPYVNLTYLDRNYIKAIFEGEKYPDGTYITNYTEDIIGLQKMYWTWIAKERERQMFTFPVLSASLLYKKGKFIDENSARFINKHNLKWQDTNWYISDSVDSVSSCCRLTSSISNLNFSLSADTEPDKLKGNVNSIGGSDLNIGSFKVVTLNIPQIAYLSEGDMDKFFNILNHKLDLILDTLFIIRQILKERIAQGVLPLYEKKLLLLERQYGTIGFTGMWEALEILGKTQITMSGKQYTAQGKELVDKILDKIQEKIDEGFKKYKFTFNTEQVPAEQAAVKLAQKDAVLFSGNSLYINYPLYSNQWTPLTADVNVLDRIRYSAKWDKKVSGGAILHVNINSPFETEEESWNMVNLIANSGVIYFAFNQRISVCENKHSFIGNVCPICGMPKADEYLRIVGYLVPISTFNKVRKEVEYPNRKFYQV